VLFRPHVGRLDRCLSLHREVRGVTSTGGRSLGTERASGHILEDPEGNVIGVAGP
jgi:hypothetical protein